MRLWSLHPKYLDVKGLCGLWREALQAQRILAGGPPYKVPYGNHPQLLRFKTHADPLAAIGYYLRKLYEESQKRKYNFNFFLIADPYGNPWESNIHTPDKWDPWHHPRPADWEKIKEN